MPIARMFIFSTRRLDGAIAAFDYSTPGIVQNNFNVTSTEKKTKTFSH